MQTLAVDHPEFAVTGLTRLRKEVAKQKDRFFTKVSMEVDFVFCWAFFHYGA